MKKQEKPTGQHKVPSIFEFLLLFLSLIVIFPGKTSANDLERLKQQSEYMSIKEERLSKKIQLLAGAEYFMATNMGKKLAGPGANIAVLYGVHEKVGAGLAIRQGFSKGFGLFFTQIDLRASYAITGRMVRDSKCVFIGEKEVVTITGKTSGNLRATFHASQYNFNRTIAVTTYSGFGLSLSYDLPTIGKLNYFLGTRMDRIKNGKSTLTPIQLFVGAGMWL